MTLPAQTPPKIGVWIGITGGMLGTFIGVAMALGFADATVAQLLQYIAETPGALMGLGGAALGLLCAALGVAYNRRRTAKS